MQQLVRYRIVSYSTVLVVWYVRYCTVGSSYWKKDWKKEVGSGEKDTRPMIQLKIFSCLFLLSLILMVCVEEEKEFKWQANFNFQLGTQNRLDSRKELQVQ